MADAFRRRRGGRIALWSLVIALTAGGIWLMAYPFVTDLWAGRLQDNLEQEFQQLEQAPPPAEGGLVAQPAEGKALTRLIIPKLKLRMIVVEGVSGPALRAGAGHFPETPLPGSTVGNVVIAGHRTGYGDPFLHLDKLSAGDKIIFETPNDRHVYKVMKQVDGHRNPWVVEPTNLSVKATTAEPVVTLITCDPPGTTKMRLIVRAALVRDI